MMLFKKEKTITSILLTEEVKEKVINYIIEEVFKKNGSMFPEDVADDENIQCMGSSYFADIAEIMKLKTEDI